MSAFITIIVFSRQCDDVQIETGKCDALFVETVWDYMAFFLVFVALLNLIIAPLDLLRAAFQIHKIEKAQAKKHVADPCDAADLDRDDDE